MRRYLPWILLAISVALNAFFVGGHVYMRRMAEMHGPPGEGPGGAPPIGFERFNFTPAQREALKNLREAARERMQQGRTIDREIGLALLDELMKPVRDPVAIDALVHQLGERRIVGFRPTLDELATFLAGLTAEQRDKVREVAQRRGIMFLVNPGSGPRQGRAERPPPK